MQFWPPKYDMLTVPQSIELYWDPRLETMDPQQREQEWILAKLKSQLAYAYAHSPFYQHKWAKGGIDPRDIRSFEDFREPPFVSKEDIREDQRPNLPFWQQSLR